MIGHAVRTANANLVLPRQPTEKVAPERANRLSYEARTLPQENSPIATSPGRVRAPCQRKSPPHCAGLDLLTEREGFEPSIGV